MSRTDIPPRFIVDGDGKRIAVVLDPEEYESLLRAREELDDIQAYDKAKESRDDSIPFEDAVRDIEETGR